MANYIDGFIFPIQTINLDEYQKAAEKVAKIWKEHGALDYHQFVSDDLSLEGTKSFSEAVQTSAGESIVFGWVVFPSKEIRDLANKKVPADPRMKALVDPLIDPERIIFDASRMVYGGFRSLVESKRDQ